MPRASALARPLLPKAGSLRRETDKTLLDLEIVAVIRQGRFGEEVASQHRGDALGHPILNNQQGRLDVLEVYPVFALFRKTQSFRARLR